jgi:hypothetical protein
MLPGMQRVWRNEPSHSQVNSHVGSWSPEWTPKFSKLDSKGQNPFPWIFFYIIGKLLKYRCLKWARIAHLDIRNTSYGQKKGWELNWQFDSRPIKVGNRPDFLACRQCGTYHWKAFNEIYNFALNLIAIGGLHRKLCALKVARVSVVVISGLPLGSPRTKNHLDVAPVERCRVYYKGEGGGFPQVRAVVNFVCSSCPWFVLAPKVFQLCTNHFVLVLCKSVWVNKLHFFLFPSWSSSTPLYPSIMLRIRERAPTLLPFTVFSFRTHIWVPQGVVSASQTNWLIWLCPCF